jgi:hypothetical protein
MKCYRDKRANWVLQEPPPDGYFIIELSTQYVTTNNTSSGRNSYVMSRCCSRQNVCAVLARDEDDTLIKCWDERKTLTPPTGLYPAVL